MSAISTSAIRLIAVCGLAASSAVLVGCDGGDPVAEAVGTASARLSAVGGSGALNAPREQREAVYQQVASSLESAIREGDGSPAEGAAHALLAQARAGQGAIDAVEAESAGAELLRLVSVAEATIRSLEEKRRTASLAATFEPDAELADAAAERAGHTQRLATADGVVDGVRDEIARVRADIERELAAARTARLEETRLRAQALRASPLERASLIEQAVDDRRVAEQRERRGAELELDAVQLERRLADATAEALSAQRAITAIDELVGRIGAAATANDEAASNRSDAIAATEQSLDALVQSIAAGVNERFLPAVDAAIADYRLAVAASNRTAGRTRDLGSATQAGAQQSLASLHLLKAVVLSRVTEFADTSGRSAMAGQMRPMIEEAASEASAAFAAAAAGSSCWTA